MHTWGVLHGSTLSLIFLLRHFRSSVKHLADTSIQSCQFVSEETYLSGDDARTYVWLTCELITRADLYPLEVLHEG